MPYAGIFFLFFVLVVSVKQYLLSSCCFVRATAVILFVLFCPCNRCLFLFSTYGVPLASNCSLSFPFLSFPIFLHHILQNTCRLFCFVAFFLFFPSFLFSFFSLFLWSGLFCCVLVPGTLALHLLYLDELRTSGSLCFTVVRDHIICISLRLISTDYGCTDVVG